MNYELVSVVRPETDNWKHQLARAKMNGSKVLTLMPDPLLQRHQKETGIDILNTIDYVTKRTYDPERSLFFDKVPTVEGAEVFMNADWKVSIIKDGVRIGTMRTFPNTRRLVQDVAYFSGDGTHDVTEEYTYDGQLYSNIFYFRDAVSEIDFVNNQEQVCLRFHFYEGNLNLITIEDPKSNKVIEHYDNMTQFQTAQITKIVRPGDNVGITYLGIELDVLANTESNNTVFLDEPAFDENGKIKGNLKLIMDDVIKYVQHVVVRKEDYALMKKMGQDLTKVRYYNQIL